MKLLVITVGLPRSGKSTYARQLGVPIVCPDAIRLAVHGQRFLASSEPLVWSIARTMVLSLFHAGHDVVVLDATNITRRRRDEWDRPEWQRQFVVITTPANICLARAAGDLELEAVIRRMASSYEPLSAEEMASAHDVIHVDGEMPLVPLVDP